MQASQNPIENNFISDVAKGPLRTVKSYSVYFINGFKYHTQSHGNNRATTNSGVCIKGELMDYYGKITEILEIEYPALPIKHCVLFKCEWFDPTPNVGIKVNCAYNLVKINQRRRLANFEPFVLAMQATQVYYLPFPSLRLDKMDWLAVCKVKPRGIFEMKSARQEKRIESEAFQEEEVEGHEINENLPYRDNEPLNSMDNEFVDIGSDEESKSTSELESEFDSNYSENEEYSDNNADDSE